MRRLKAAARSCAKSECRRGWRSFYEETVRAKLTEQFGYTNRMQVPTLDKIVLNMGIGEGVNDRKKVDQAASDLALIAGQKPVITKSRKSVANFKLRDGQAIGCKVTLRSARMYEFIDRLINIALPRVRDFRGLNPEELRRPRQLFDGREGTHHFPGDRLRQGQPRSGAWTSPFARPRAPTTKRAPCLRHSTSRSGSEGQRSLKRGNLGDTNGEEEFDREE